MNFNIGNNGEVKIITVFKNTETLDNNNNELYKYLKEKDLFKGNIGEVYSNISYNGDKFVLVGLGEENKLSFDGIRKAFYKVGKELINKKVESVNISVSKFKDLCYKKTNQAIIEGLLQSEYSFEKYLTTKKVIPTVKEVYLQVLEGKEEKINEAITETKNLVEGIFLARDLVNEPAINIYPETLANSAREELESLSVQIDIFGKDKIKELGMHAFLAVAEGSSKEPQFIVMTYNGDPDSDKKVALVGKGLTYDSGGYSIKPAEGMVTMHSDMAGSAAVIGAMKTIALAKLKKNVVAIVASCENMISGCAYKTGDIIGSMSGKTIEVLNTDAEGRLTLADALWYAVKVVKADQVVDVATLTGACMVALGDVNTGAITNDETLMSNVKKAAELAGEPVWELPSNDEYRDLIKGTFADLKNTGGRWGGAITAGLFLEEFVDNTPWVHLDIAGTAYLSSAKGYLPKGATGVPVKTLYYLIKESN